MSIWRYNPDSYFQKYSSEKTVNQLVSKLRNGVWRGSGGDPAGIRLGYLRPWRNAAGMVFPAWLPERNPVEQCWNQFKARYMYRFIEALPALKRTLSSAFASIDEPDILDYICPSTGD